MLNCSRTSNLIPGGEGGGGEGGGDGGGGEGGGEGGGDGGGGGLWQPAQTLPASEQVPVPPLKVPPLAFHPLQ